MQPNLSKVSANRRQYKIKITFIFIVEVQPNLSKNQVQKQKREKEQYAIAETLKDNVILATFDLFDFSLYNSIAPFISYKNIGKNENA